MLFKGYFLKRLSLSQSLAHSTFWGSDNRADFSAFKIIVSKE